MIESIQQALREERLSFLKPVSQVEIDQTIKQVHEETDQKEINNEPDHYAFMNEADKHMIGKPPDAQTWEFIDKMIKTRERNAKIMFVVNLIYAALPFIIFALI